MPSPSLRTATHHGDRTVLPDGFRILGGKFSFIKITLSRTNGNISTGAVEVSALFTEGNIIEAELPVEYLEADQRRDFIAVMRWRDEQVNKLCQ